MSVQIQVATPADRERVIALLQAQLDEHSIRPEDAALEQVVERLQQEPGLPRFEATNPAESDCPAVDA